MLKRSSTSGFPISPNGHWHDHGPRPDRLAGESGEPLESWAARREARRAALREIVGHRRAIALGEGARATHVAPREPQLLLEWDGTVRVTVGVAENADQTREFLGHVPPPAGAIETVDRQPRRQGTAPARVRLVGGHSFG